MRTETGRAPRKVANDRGTTRFGNSGFEKGAEWGMVGSMKMFLSLALLTGLAAGAAGQPVITPSNLTVNAGASFQFAATVSSTNVVGFQWVFDGTNIAGATNASLYEDNPSTDQAGVYWVEARNRDRSTSSNSATLTVLQGTIVNFRISTFAGGTSSNVLVELFDHDKPATVENFVHYVRTRAYSNMFFDRLIPGFVLQGGDYDAQDDDTAPDAVAGGAYFTNVLNIDRVLRPRIARRQPFAAGPD